MSDSSEREEHWLEERLQRLDVDMDRVPVVHSDLRPVVERGNPWVVELGTNDPSRILDRILQDSDLASRVILVTDVEEDPVARVQTAVLLAKAATSRGLSVLLVDTDVQRIGLSRWLPDEDFDAEGFVDVINYGASVHGVSLRGPESGIEIVGVGSYRPDTSDLLEDDALRRFAGQLRGRHDLVLLITAAWMPNDRFHPLLVHADAAVLTLHGERSLAPAVEDLAEYLLGLDVSLCGILAYAGPDRAEEIVDDLFRTRPIQTLTPAEVAMVTPEPDDETSFAEVGAGVADRESDADAPDAESFEDLYDRARADRSQESTGTTSRSPYASHQGRRSHASSPLPKIAFTIAVVVVVGFLGWWGFVTLRESPSVEEPRVRRPEDAAVAQATQEEQVREHAEPAGDHGGVGQIEEPVADEAAQNSPPDGADDVDSGAAAGESARTADAGDGGAAVVATEPPVRADVPAVEDSAPSVPEVSRDAADSPAGALADALARAEGSGWALHLFSFPDSTEAVEQVGRLERDGVGAVVRGALIEGKGRWYRVLVGRFGDRAAALAARDEATRRFRVDWVGVVHVR